MAASVRQAEWESEQARADLALADLRLGTDIAWNDVRKGFGRATDVALRRYAAYLRDGYLAEVRTTLPHAAQRVLETRTVYQRIVQEFSTLAEGQVPVQPDLIAPHPVEALEVLRDGDGWEVPAQIRAGADALSRDPGGMTSRILARAFRR